MPESAHQLALTDLELNRSLAEGGLVAAMRPTLSAPVSINLVRVQAADYEAFSVERLASGSFSVVAPVELTSTQPLRSVTQWPLVSVVEILRPALLPARLPFVLSTGMEMNAYVAFFVVGAAGFSWQDALGMVYIRPEAARVALITALSQQHEEIRRTAIEILNAVKDERAVDHHPHQFGPDPSGERELSGRVAVTRIEQPLSARVRLRALDEFGQVLAHCCRAARDLPGEAQARLDRGVSPGEPTAGTASGARRCPSGSRRPASSQG